MGLRWNDENIDKNLESKKRYVELNNKRSYEIKLIRNKKVF